jgi:purine-binding chemotaxis protein CheW
MAKQRNINTGSETIAASPTDGTIVEDFASGTKTKGDANIQQFVTFQVEREVFAFPMSDVREIIRFPEVTRVPLSPPTLEGMANLRGKVLPIVNLRRTFNFDQIEYNDATRVVIVEQDASLVGFVVDRVASVISVEPEQLESADAIDSTIDAKMMTSIIKNVQGHAMVMVLDARQLNNFDLLKSGKEKQNSISAASSSEDRSVDLDEISDERQFVSFVVANQEYAFPIERVQEIVQVPDDISQVPNAQSHVLGVMTLRSRLLPLVSLRQMFNLPMTELTTDQRLVVISLDGEDSQRTGATVGIVMDSVNEVLRIPSKIIDDLPPYLARTNNMSEIESVCRLDDGKRIVSVISVDRLFQHAVIKKALEAGESNSAETETADDNKTQMNIDDEVQLVVFRLAGEEYGVEIDSVQEIIRVPETITRVPKTDIALEGVVNLRGNVLPAVDLRARFGLEKMERDDRQRIVVFSLGGLRAGFIVDSVLEVMKIGQSTIESVPSLSEEQSHLMGQVANLEKMNRMVMILDAENLLNSETFGSLANVATQAAA